MSKSVEDKPSVLLVQLVDDWFNEYAPHYFIMLDSHSIVCKCARVEWTMGWVDGIDKLIASIYCPRRSDWTLQTREIKVVDATSPNFFADMRLALDRYHEHMTGEIV